MKKNKILFIVLILLNTVVCFADTGFDDDVQDAPFAPINGWVYVVMIAAACYGYKSIMNYSKKHNKKVA